MSRNLFAPSIRLLAAFGTTALLCVCRAGEAPAPAPGKMALTNLVFVSDTQVFHAELTDRQATFTFQFTNVSEVPVHILGIPASCNCTRAELPKTPWIIPPHAQESLHVVMDINPVIRDNTKYLTLLSTNGTKQLWVKYIMTAPTNAAAITNATAGNK